MLKGRGKGKIPNDLVAASCAAVLAVYAAGYSRTRDAASRFENHVRLRRPAVPTTPVLPATEPAAAGRGPVVIEASKPQSHPAHETVAASAVAERPESRPPSPAVPRKRAPEAAVSSSTAVATGSSSPGALPQIMPVPLPAAADAVARPIAIRRDPAFAADAKWRDGTYTGRGYSAHGDIEARVVIQAGRIVEAGIATCGTLYPCDVIEPLIRQPVARQSPDIDYMSHASESSNAYYDALVDALGEALVQPPSDATTP